MNFSKSLLVGVNVAYSWLVEAALVLQCKVGSIPFVYLGLPIGGNARRLSFWEPIINRIKSRLSGWNSKHLSMGGRLVLLKSVLSSLPVYALSFFKALLGIVSSIESMFNFFFFFLGGGVMTTVKYHGWIGKLFVGIRRLGVRSIREFSLALLGKWCWRLLEERESLWFKVLSARYGVDGGRPRVIFVVAGYSCFV